MAIASRHRDDLLHGLIDETAPAPGSASTGAA